MTMFARKLAFTTALATALVVAPFAVMAEPVAQEFDVSHTYVGFEIDHFGFSTTYGQFEQLSGDFALDMDNPAASSVNVTIDVKSLDTGHDLRDEHLMGEKWLNGEAFPTMTFASETVEVTGENTARVTGNLTLLGVTKPVTLDVTHTKTGPHPFDPSKTVSGFNASTTIKRSDFGMTHAVPAVGDEVKIVISTEVSPKAVAAEKAE